MPNKGSQSDAKNVRLLPALYFLGHFEIMIKTQLIVLLSFIIVGCVGHHESSKLDLVAIEISANKLEHMKIGLIPESNWPIPIRELSPENIVKKNDGIYISLDSFWVEESGLFIPANGKKITQGSDPSYKLLGGNIYSYYIRG